MKFLITGSNGLLGQKLIHKLSNTSAIDLIASSIGKNRLSKKSNYKYVSLDITNEDNVNDVISRESPDVVINTAAMTNVDLCEDEKDACDALNIRAVRYLANACSTVGAHLIHISTDFIFDGEHGPYKEEDNPNPLSYYGFSKLKSEQVLYQHKCNWTILRTIIIFGVGESLSKGNIVLWAKGALEKGEDLNIIDDQFRAPTLAEDLADACILAANKKAYGIFNASGKDIMSIYEMVERIGKYYKLNTTSLNRISTDTLNQKAKRPPRTGFVLDKAKKVLGYNPHSFEESLSIIQKQLK
ncbi:MAG: SDR family oxidoreductase [Bacteroidota bacterium]|nr:SDR family oxidoreductase [Bacteroidota bacterium]